MCLVRSTSFPFVYICLLRVLSFTLNALDQEIIFSLLFHFVVHYFCFYISVLPPRIKPIIWRIQNSCTEFMTVKHFSETVFIFSHEIYFPCAVNSILENNFHKCFIPLASDSAEQ